MPNNFVFIAVYFILPKREEDVFRVPTATEFLGSVLELASGNAQCPREAAGEEQRNRRRGVHTSEQQQPQFCRSWRQD